MTVITAGAGCKKGDSGGGSSNRLSVPVLTTTDSSHVTGTSLQTGGAIVSDGGSAITARGVCWSTTNQTPTIDDNKTLDGSGTGSFTSHLTDLTPYSYYYIRAYATNGSGTGYGKTISTRTSEGVTLHTMDVEETNHQRWCSTDLTIHGVTSSNPPQISDAGVCWSTSSRPTINDSKASYGAVFKGYIQFTLNLLFAANSKYYIRGYAISNVGTFYGNEVTYTTGVDIGLYTGGGIIFYIDNTGQHGLVAAQTDQAKNVPWAPNGLENVSTYATSQSDGANNTTAIINTYGRWGTYAAQVCRDYQGGGFTDWYLPAGNEMYAMQNNMDCIGGFPAPEHFEQYYYWSSTEFDYFRASEYDFNKLYFLIDNTEKWRLRSVRAIRHF